MPVNLVSLLFDQLKASLASFVSNDLSIGLLAMLSLFFIVWAYSKIHEIFNLGLDKDEVAAKNAFGRWQQSRGTWREPLMRDQYYDSISHLRNRSIDSDEEEEIEDSPFSPTIERMMNDNKTYG